MYQTHYFVPTYTIPNPAGHAGHPYPRENWSEWWSNIGPKINENWKKHEGNPTFPRAELNQFGSTNYGFSSENNLT